MGYEVTPRELGRRIAFREIRAQLHQRGRLFTDERNKTLSISGRGNGKHRSNLLAAEGD